MIEQTCCQWLFCSENLHFNPCPIVCILWPFVAHLLSAASGHSWQVVVICGRLLFVAGY